MSLCEKCMRPMSRAIPPMDAIKGYLEGDVCTEADHQRILAELNVPPNKAKSCAEVRLLEALKETCDTLEVYKLAQERCEKWGWTDHDEKSLANWRELWKELS